MENTIAIKAGDTFSRWTVLNDAGTKVISHTIDKRNNKPLAVTKRFYLCKCQCGSVKEVSRTNLLSGMSKGCNICRKRQKRGHGNNPTFRHPLQATYTAMVNRCTNPKASSYTNYGGRGIKVCDNWLGVNGFKNFIKDMGAKPNPSYSIDRINNNGNYEPSNCRWASRLQQANNKSYTDLLTPARLARITGYSSQRIRELMKSALSKFIKQTGKRLIFEHTAIKFLNERRRKYLEFQKL